MLTGKTKRGVELWRLNGVNRAEKRREWVVVGDGTQVVIYENDPRGKALRTIRRLEFPKGRLPGSEALADRSGRFTDGWTRGAGASGMRHGLGEDHSFHELYVDEMSRRVGQLLSKARAENLFTELTLIAEPRLMGHLKRHLDHHTQERVGAIIEKDYARLPMPSLLQLLHQQR